MSGFYLMHRGWMDNPVFSKEPFTERTAWIWLIEEAAWKPARRRMGSVIVDVERGQLVASVRYLADVWGWNKSRVERFLGRLTNERMIWTQSETGVTVISVCNYDKYQTEKDTSETQTETEARQERDRSETKKKEGKEVNNIPPIIPPGDEFDQFWKICPRKLSKGSAERAFKRARKNVELDTILDGMKRYAAEMAGQDPQFIKHPATWLNGQCWADEPVKASAKTPISLGSTMPIGGGVADSQRIAALVSQTVKWVETPEGMRKVRVA